MIISRISIKRSWQPSNIINPHPWQARLEHVGNYSQDRWSGGRSSPGIHHYGCNPQGGLIYPGSLPPSGPQASRLLQALYRRGGGHGLLSHSLQHTGPGGHGGEDPDR